MSSLLSNVSLSDSTGMRFAKLQRWVRDACDRAGIGYTVGGLLSDISLSDSEGQRFAKLQRWVRVLSEGIASASGADASIVDTTDLAAIPTADLAVPQLKMWTNETTLTFEVWRLLASTDSDDPTNGVVRPADYNGVTNAKVWFRRGT